MPNAMYCRAILHKSGLGNRLFPWARCRLFSFLNDIPMLSPAWSQIKVGPLLRRESDLRLYHNLFLKREGDISGLKRLWLENTLSSVPETANSNSPSRKGNGIIKVFQTEGDRFGSLNGGHEFLLAELRLITRPKWLSAADEIGTVDIGMHIRMGDFSIPASERDLYGGWQVRIPMSWFGDTMESIRKAVGSSAKAIVVSDGTDDELRGLSRIENVKVLRTGSAIGDLLTLANSRILIGSASSSFTAWASFLGQMPTAIHPSGSMEWFNLEASKNQYLGTFDPGSPASEFICQAKAILAEVGA